MILTRCLAVSLALLIPAAPPAPQESPGQIPVLKVIDSGQTVELNLDEAKLWDFLEAAQPVLAVPINFEPGEVANVRIKQPGLQRVPWESFRDAFDGVLRRYDFMSWDDTSGGSTVIMVSKVSPGGRWRVSFTPRLITSQELEAGPSPRLAMYTMNFPLQHVAARDMLGVLMPTFDTSTEIMRPVEGANALLVTATREHLLAARDLLAAVDKPGPEGGLGAERLAKLEQQVSDMAARLAKLEAAGR